MHQYKQSYRYKTAYIDACKIYLLFHTCICNSLPEDEPSVSKHGEDFDVLLTVHLSILISVFNQLDAQNLFHNKFYFTPLHVSSTCARNMQRHKIKVIVKQILCIKLVKY